MHQSVMLQETIDGLAVRENGLYVDGTLGSGGHAEAILDAGRGGVRLIGLDRDPAALARSAHRLARFGTQVELVHANYADMGTVLRERGERVVDGIVLDLGVSSDQLDTAERGFSFRLDGPLDMRMDPTRGESAAELVNTWSEEALVDVIRRFGEERQARGIVRAILRARDQGAIETTTQLAEIVERAIKGWRGAKHPATRTFQALRIAVNGELDAVADVLETGITWLAPNGRMAVISFHSLEDRLVKRAFAAHAGRWESLQAGGRQWCGTRPAVARVTRGGLRPGEDETAQNPRARSATLRVVRRLTESETEALDLESGNPRSA